MAYQAVYLELEEEVKYESYTPDHDACADIVLAYWDLVQVRYHMLRALKLLRGEGMEYAGMTYEEQAMEELEMGHRLNNHLMAEIEHVKEI
jgi:hypothetical protein